MNNIKNKNINVSRETINSHYKTSKIEPIEFIKGTEFFEGFCIGNIIKYVSRCNHKGSKLQDLEKAKYYIEKIIEEVKNNENK